MAVIDVARDPQALTLSITAHLFAPPARAWQLWSEERQRFVDGPKVLHEAHVDHGPRAWTVRVTCAAESLGAVLDLALATWRWTDEPATAAAPG